MLSSTHGALQIGKKMLPGFACSAMPGAGSADNNLGPKTGFGGLLKGSLARVGFFMPAIPDFRIFQAEKVAILEKYSLTQYLYAHCERCFVYSVNNGVHLGSEFVQKL